MTKSLFITAIALLAASFSGCQKDNDSDGPAAISDQYIIKEAKDIWKGQEVNVVNSYMATDTEVADTLLTFTLSMSADRTPAAGVALDLIVNSDSLNQVIQKAQTESGQAYAIFKDARAMPTQFYTLSATSVSAASSAKLSIKRQDLIDFTLKNRASATYVLPISLKSANYKVNSALGSIFYICRVTYKAPDSSKEPDFSEAPQTLDNGRTLVWQDEFNTDGPYDAEMWVPENGFCRNHEDQWYQGANAVVRGGNLVITAKKERKTNPDYEAGSSDWKKSREYAEYTSASLISNFTFNRGTLICRAKLPCKSGTWPAIWTTGHYSGWPDGAWEWPYGGEIDIMEYYPNHSTGLPSIHANVCWGTNTRWSGAWDSMNVPVESFGDLEWSERYHVWRMDWDMDNIMLYCDGQLINQIEMSKTINGNGSWWGDDAWNAGAWRNPFTDTDWNPCYQQIFLNLALGGDNGGTIDDSPEFEYLVDYIRVYQTTGGNEVNRMK